MAFLRCFPQDGSQIHIMNMRTFHCHTAFHLWIIQLPGIISSVQTQSCHKKMTSCGIAVGSPRLAKNSNPFNCFSAQITSLLWALIQSCSAPAHGPTLISLAAGGAAKCALGTFAGTTPSRPAAIPPSSTCAASAHHRHRDTG